MSCTFCDVKPYLSEEQLTKLKEIAAVQSDLVGSDLSWMSALGFIFRHSAFDQLLNDQYLAHLAMCKDIKPLDKGEE